MESPRETMTDSLAAIIQIIHLGYQSGTLTVERGEGRTLEEGIIVFASGRVVEARLGQYRGMAAFNVLNSWQACRFSFVNGTQVTPQQGFTPLPPGRGKAPTQQTTSPLQSNTQSGNIYKQALSPAILPVRLPSGEAALQHPETMQIPRTHRRLLLLINGQRNVSELARLLVRSPEETQVLLHDLEFAGLIQQ